MALRYDTIIHEVCGPARVSTAYWSRGAAADVDADAQLLRDGYSADMRRARRGDAATRIFLPTIRRAQVTFLGEPSEELDAATSAKGHTHYAQLHPFILSFHKTTFILVHWSLRYSKEDVLAFFEDQYGGVPENVVLWI